MKKETFVNYNNWFYAKVAAFLFITFTIIYSIDDPIGGRRGSTFTGYFFGIIATLGILYLTYFGIKKRSYHSSTGNLMKSLSSHIWLGILLVIVVPFHSGFSFGANVHTLAFIAMAIVITSGIFGAICYKTLPKTLTSQRGDAKKEDIIKMISEADAEIKTLLNKNENLKYFAKVIEQDIESLKTDSFKIRKKSFDEKKISDLLSQLEDSDKDLAITLLTLEQKKTKLLDQIIEEERSKLFLRIWLVIHIPFTFLLIILLAIHIFTALYYRT